MSWMSSFAQAGGSIIVPLFREPHVRPGLWIVAFIAFLSLFGDFLANDRPLACRLDGAVYFPAARGMMVDWGIIRWQPGLVPEKWKGRSYDWVVYAPVAWSAKSIDPVNMNAVGPFEHQRLDSPRYRHWLGTDQYGRDVAAGLVSGARVSLSVGLLSMVLAGLIGLILGSLAGYFGDQGLRLTLAELGIPLAGVCMGLFGTISLLAVPADLFGSEWLKWLALPAYLALWLALSYGCVRLVHQFKWARGSITIPADLLIMRLIEVFQSIPVLLFILSLLALFTTSSLLSIALIIGFVRWTTIARFVRAELLRIRELEYMDSARASGLTHWRILIGHALPNAMTPVLITLAFGVASAILAEASLSFLGIGVPQDTVTWGGLLQSARADVSAWWLALFPGAFIFLTVLSFNLIGEGLRKRDNR